MNARFPAGIDRRVHTGSIHTIHLPVCRNMMELGVTIIMDLYEIAARIGLDGNMVALTGVRMY